MAIGSSIRGFTKKGKAFFKFDTSHTEKIEHLHVLGTNLWSAGTYTLNCYASKNNAIADKYFFVCDDKINEMIVHHGDLAQIGQVEPYVILACNDSTLKVIGDNGRLLYQTILDSAPTCMTLVESQADMSATILLYGL